MGFGTPFTSASGDVVFDGTAVDGGTARGLFRHSAGVVTPIALQGSVAPVPGGGTYEYLSPYDINASGDFVFKAALLGGTASSAVFVAAGGRSLRW